MDNWTQDFTLRNYELDHRGKLSFAFLCRMLQEAAGTHADSLNIARARLSAEGLTWVLARFHVKLAEEVALSAWPGWKDTISVKTWRAALERLFAIRDYRVLDSRGRTLAVATSAWAMFDVNKRRMVSIPGFVLETHPKTSERALDTKYEKLPAPERVDLQKSFEAGLAHIDQNDHVNNVSYMQWAIETVPREVALSQRLVELEILFRAESVLGDRLESVAQQTSSEGAGASFVHLIGRPNDGKDVAQLRTFWRA